MDIFFDENISEYVAQAFDLLNVGHYPNVRVRSTIQAFGRGEPDEHIIPGIGQSNGILITKDLRIKRTNFQYELCKKYGIGAFFLAFPTQTHWEIIKFLVKYWQGIVDNSIKLKKPFALRVTPRGGIKPF
jgi:hypothetical protein